MPELSRRGFLTATAGLSAAGAVTSSALGAQTEARPSDFAIDDQTPFRGQTRRLKITNHGRYVTSLIFSADYPTHFRLKPEFHPVLTPAGFPVTDSHQYCFIHHQSVMCGHGRVRTEDGRVIDFYRKLSFPEEERTDKWHTKERNLYHLGPSGIQEIVDAKWSGGSKAVVDLTLHWRTRERNSAKGETILIETRRYEISQTGNHTIVDQFTKLVPVKGEAVLEADRHSFCGVRVSDLIDPEDGGTMRDSEGRVNPEGNYWDNDGERKTPKWIDCSGKIGGSTVGVALMGHPANVRNQYYMQGWGLMEVSPALGEDVSFTKEQPFRFAARYVAHDGELKAEIAEGLLKAFGRKAVEG